MSQTHATDRKLPATAPELKITGRIATITFRNPTYANRLNPTDLDVIKDYLKIVNHNEEVLVLRFIAEGKYFCSGYDISSLAAESAPSATYFGDTVDLIETVRPVTIAAIQGGVYGGGTDICLACDFRLGVPGANMFMPATKLGLHFYPGGMVRYITRLGLNNAKKLFLTSQKIESQEMLDIGFLTEMIEDEQLLARLDQLSDQIAGMAPLALIGIKKHMNLIARGIVDDTAIRAAVAISEQSHDIKEGALAWKEKRAARFTGT
jgi:enoyl-CoA hydratase/carnithine racemase